MSMSINKRIRMVEHQPYSNRARKTICNEWTLPAHPHERSIRPGSGTQSNMNVNESISNRAIQLVGGFQGASVVEESVLQSVPRLYCRLWVGKRRSGPVREGPPGSLALPGLSLAAARGGGRLGLVGLVLEFVLPTPQPTPPPPPPPRRARVSRILRSRDSRPAAPNAAAEHQQGGEGGGKGGLGRRGGRWEG